MKKTILYLLAVLIGLLAISSSFAPAHATTTVLYDNFPGSSINQNVWSFQPQSKKTSLQSTCCVTLYDQSPSLLVTLPRGDTVPNNPNFPNTYWGGIIANKTSVPAIPSTLNNSLISIAMSVRMINQSLTGVTGNLTEICPFGCTTQAFVGFANNLICGGCAISSIPGQQMLAFNLTNTSASPLFGSSAASTYSVVLQGNTTKGNVQVNLDQAGGIDLTVPHVFQVSVKLAGKNSWAAFSVDQQAVFNFTQRACQCITQAVPTNLYPIFLAEGVSPATLSFSPGAQISYAMVTDYIATPQQLPAGVFPGPTCVTNPVPGSSLNPNGICTLGGVTATDPWDVFFQKEAVIIGGGNIYFGGMVITTIFLSVILLVIAIKFTTNRFVLTFTTVGIVFLFTYFTILPWFAPLIPLSLVIATLFGILKPGMGGEGNEY